MTVQPIANPDRSTLKQAAASAIAVLALTSIHHAYGAMIYNSPWRMHVVFLAVPAAVLIAILASAAYRWSGTTLGTLVRGLALFLIVSFPILVIGLYEGGYNHVLKNIVHFTGTHDLFAWMFPGSIYEPPSDLFFEATGIAQFVVASVACNYALRALRARKN